MAGEQVRVEQGPLRELLSHSVQILVLDGTRIRYARLMACRSQTVATVWRAWLRRWFAGMVCLFALAAATLASENKPLLGFSTDSAREQRALEARFDALLNRDNLRDWMKRMSARPHHTGSAYDKENAQFMVALLADWGYDAALEEFQVLFPTPKKRSLEMIAPTRFQARLEEPKLKGDSTSGVTKERLPPYNAYSIDGNVTAPLVYVNYGVPADYEVLARHGIDVTGQIVIARYGGSWRGIKPKVAAEHGAVGCLIYSDPRDDGFFQGDVYPKGSWRNEQGAQRGSVADIPLYPGDPLTPGIGATKDARRLAVEDAPTLTKIPVLPISHADALPLLRALGGPVAPESWRGALPITYHIGPGPAVVRLKLEFNWNLVRIYNVIARLPGAERPDQWIIRGNHHDAWVFGADDPLSGTVTVLEEARAVSQLVKQGWKPKRTIIYALWDAEEPGLIGSTEWVETHAEELDRHAVLYINGDTNGRGFLRVGGSHTLEKFVNEIAREVSDPQRNIPVADRLRAWRQVQGTGTERSEARTRADLRIGALGSGSDYSPFLQHLGIASLDIRYGGEDLGGSYHSIYDSFDHFVRFGDPGFEYGIALVQTAGRAVLRSANADVLPFEFSNFADTVATYLKEVTRLADDLRAETAQANQLIEKGTLSIVADPMETFVPPQPRPLVPKIDFAPLQKALGRLQDSARQYDLEAKRSGAGVAALPVEVRRQLDALLIRTERALTRPEGLPRRPWYRHFVYAPGFYTGYGVKTLPGVREAIEQRNWVEAREQIGLAAETLEGMAKVIDQAKAALADRPRR